MSITKKLTIMAAIVVILSLPFPSSAATGTKISSVSLRISSDIEVGTDDSDITVTSSSSKFSVDDAEITNVPSDEWEDGDKPKIKITLIAEDDYYFPSGFTKSSISISGSDGTVTSVSRSSSSKLLVYVTLDALEEDDEEDSDYELEVSGLEWDESDGTAYWDDAEDAEKYEVRLYRGSSSVTSVFTTSRTSYDFSSYITRSGYYTFRVRGVYNSSNKGSWEESDSWYVSSDEAEEISSSSSSSSSSGAAVSYTGPGVTASYTEPGGAASDGAWLRDSVGWWYCNADKSYTTNNWQYIGNQWYFFDESGYMVTGWVNWNSNWYYCGDNGAMLTNATTPDGYYVGSDGAWIQ